MPFGDDNIETFRSRRCRTATLAMAFLFLAVAAAALIPMEETDAVTFTDGDFEYITSDTAGLAVVTAYTDTGTDVVVPSEVEYEGVTYTVVLASDTFTYNTEITSVTLPDTIIEITEYTFSGCTSLETVTMPADMMVISGVMFENCDSLTTVNLTGEGRYVSDDGVVFSQDGSELVYFPAGRTGEYTVPESVSTIGRCAFQGSSLTNVVYGGHVTTVEPFAFDHSDIGTAVVLAGTEYGNGAFNFSAISSLVIQDGVMHVPDAFNYCEGLSRIVIPESVLLIDGSAFMGCVNVDTILIMPTDIRIQSGAFDLGTSLQGADVTVHTDFTGIEDSMFGDYTTYTVVPIEGIGDEEDGSVTSASLVALVVAVVVAAIVVGLVLGRPDE